MIGKKFSVADDRSVIRVALALLLVFPYIIWLFQIKDWSWPRIQEWQGALLLSGQQALFSSVLSMVGGFLLFRALQGFTNPWQLRWAEVNLLIPNLLPPLFTVMGILTIGSWFTDFPYGMGVVVFVHAVMNAGLVAVAIDRAAHAKIAGLGEAAWLMGATPHRIWWQVAWPLLRIDLACIFLFIFALCLTSFSVPLLLSGERAVSLEVAIYDYVRVDGRWDKAVILAALQTLILLGLAALLPKPFWPPRQGRGRIVRLALPFGRSIIFLPTGLLLFGWSLGFGSSIDFYLEPVYQQAIGSALLTSLSLGVAVGLVHLLLFLSVAYVFPHEALSRFLNGYLAPSPVITGFAMILIPVEGEWIDFTKLVIALTLISFPLLYRWLVHSALEGLKPQIEVARTLGASWSRILFDVVGPQAGPQIFRASALAAMWAVGDFALADLLLGQSVTLPLLIEDLLNHYRIEAAYLLLAPLMLVCFAVYALFAGVSKHVHR